MMKNRFLFVAMLFATLSLGFASCDDKKGSEPDDPTKGGQTEQTEQNGSTENNGGEETLTPEAPITFTLTLLSSNEAMGTVTEGGTYEKDSEVIIEATAKKEACVFVKWSDGNTENPRTLTMTENLTLTAEFDYAYVDLGLPSGLKWATCNVGADSVHHYGNYYAWGETAPKSSYNSSTYTYSSNLNTLPLSNDAASVNMGGSWRIPTYDEIEELKTECTWTWTNDYNGTGVAGRIVTSKINGNSIFLPAAGWCSDSGLRFTGSNGGYWSSSLSTDNSPIVQGLNFSSLNVGWRYYGIHYLDYEGLSVRGVSE